MGTAELTRLADAVTTIPVSEIEEAAFFEHDVYDCWSSCCQQCVGYGGFGCERERRFGSFKGCREV
ncbi:hypothetical protein B0H19DRAFT_1101080 [Mycena capillaripes]|nr:hypothetical protein B0H19DRAFT_1101080 [Mycena capillaripes]